MKHDRSFAFLNSFILVGIAPATSFLGQGYQLGRRPAARLGPGPEATGPATPTKFTECLPVNDNLEQALASVV